MTGKLTEMQDMFQSELHTSLHKAFLQTATPLKMTHWATKLLQLYPYQISTLQELKPADYKKHISLSASSY